MRGQGGRATTLPLFSSTLREEKKHEKDEVVGWGIQPRIREKKISFSEFLWNIFILAFLSCQKEEDKKCCQYEYCEFVLLPMSKIFFSWDSLVNHGWSIFLFPMRTRIISRQVREGKTHCEMTSLLFLSSSHPGHSPWIPKRKWKEAAAKQQTVFIRASYERRNVLMIFELPVLALLLACFFSGIKGNKPSHNFPSKKGFWLSTLSTCYKWSEDSAPTKKVKHDFMQTHFEILNKL